MGDRAAPGPPDFGALHEPGRLRAFRQAEQALRRGQQRQVAGRQHVAPAQREQQIDFRRPAADALDRDKGGDRFFVRQPLQPVEIERARSASFGEGPGIADLRPAEAEGAQGVFVERQQRPRRDRADRRFEAAPDRAGAGDRKLLADDGAQQRGETGRTRRRSSG